MTNSYDKDALIRLLQGLAPPTTPTFGSGLDAPFGSDFSSPFFAPTQPPPSRGVAGLLNAFPPAAPSFDARLGLLGAFELPMPTPPQNPFASFLGLDPVAPPVAPRRPCPGSPILLHDLSRLQGRRRHTRQPPSSGRV